MTDLTTDGAVSWGNLAAGELADDSVNDDDINWGDLTYLTTNGAGINETYASGWNADVGPPEKDDVYDYLHQFDADDDGSFTDETWLTGWIDTFSELDSIVADKALVNKADGAVWLGTHDFGGATLEIDNDESTDAALGNLGEIHIRGDEDRLSAHIGAGGEVAGEVTKSFLDMIHISVDPGSWYDSDTQICLFDVQAKKFPNGIIIDYWEVDCLLDPDVEMNLNLGYSNDWDDIADPNLIDVLDTTNGKSSEDTDSNINGGTAVAAGSVIFLYFDADPEGTCVQMIFEMIFHAEED